MTVILPAAVRNRSSGVIRPLCDFGPDGYSRLPAPASLRCAGLSLCDPAFGSLGSGGSNPHRDGILAPIEYLLQLNSPPSPYSGSDYWSGQQKVIQALSPSVPSFTRAAWQMVSANVTGSLTPDATGVYRWDGTMVNGHPRYLRSDGAYYLWYQLPSGSTIPCLYAQVFTGATTYTYGLIPSGMSNGELTYAVKDYGSLPMGPTALTYDGAQWVLVWPIGFGGTFTNGSLAGSYTPPSGSSHTATITAVGAWVVAPVSSYPSPAAGFCFFPDNVFQQGYLSWAYNASYDGAAGTINLPTALVGVPFGPSYSGAAAANLAWSGFAPSVGDATFLWSNVPPDQPNPMQSPHVNRAAASTAAVLTGVNVIGADYYGWGVTALPTPSAVSISPPKFSLEIVAGLSDNAHSIVHAEISCNNGSVEYMALLSDRFPDVMAAAGLTLPFFSCADGTEDADWSSSSLTVSLGA